MVEDRGQAQSQRGQVDERALLVAIGLSALTLATFFRVLWCRFVDLDDLLYVTANNHVKQGLSLHQVWWALTTLDASNWQPLTWLSHMSDVSFYGLDPAGHHLTSLLIHVFNVILLFAWLRSATNSMWKSSLVAALFGLHPLALESVAFIAERKNVLSTFFFLVMLLAYGWYARKPNIQRYLLVTACLALSLMSKAMLVTAPFLLLVLDYWPLRRLDLSAGDHRLSSGLRLSLEKLPLLALAVACSIVTMKAQGLDHEIKAIPLFPRIANAIISYGIYLRQMVFPSNLAVFYPFRDYSLLSWEVLASAGAIIAISVLALRQAKRRPYIIVGWLWYLGTLVPVIGLVHVGDLSHADRYTYVPLIGVFIAITWGVEEVVRNRPSLRYTSIAAVTAAIAALAVTTVRDIGYWHDSTSIAEHSIAATGSNCLMERALGESLYSSSRVDEALVHLMRSAKQQPTDSALFDIGTIKLQRKQLDEARFYFEQGLLYPSQPEILARIHQNLALIDLQQRQFADAEKHFKQSLELNPGDARHRVAYGWMLLQESRYAEAILQFEIAVKTNPDPLAWFYLGSALEKTNRLAEASDAYRQSLILAPNLQDAQTRLNAIASAGRPSK